MSQGNGKPGLLDPWKLSKAWNGERRPSGLCPKPGEGPKAEGEGAVVWAEAKMNEPLREPSLEIGEVATGSDAGPRAGGL